MSIYEVAKIVKNLKLMGYDNNSIYNTISFLLKFGGVEKWKN